MQISLNINSNANINAEIDIIGKIISYLNNSSMGWERVPCLDKHMDSFSMNDLLLVDPDANIIKKQVINKNCTDTLWEASIQSKIASILNKKYQRSGSNLTENEIATTTAVLINKVLKMKILTNLYCINVVNRGRLIIEFELMFLDEKMEDILEFYNGLLSVLLNCEIEYELIPTYFTWAQTAVALRTVNSGKSFGALGFVRCELLGINSLIGKKNVCLLGIPIESLKEMCFKE
ncbi:MAG: hypothetical protein R3Y32_00055 [Bacillota bacterium]